jgi:hypothetical protein
MIFPGIRGLLMADIQFERPIGKPPLVLLSHNTWKASFERLFGINTAQKIACDFPRVSVILYGLPHSVMEYLPGFHAHHISYPPPEIFLRGLVYMFRGFSRFLSWVRGARPVGSRKALLALGWVVLPMVKTQLMTRFAEIQTVDAFRSCYRKHNSDIRTFLYGIVISNYDLTIYVIELVRSQRASHGGPWVVMFMRNMTI